MKEKKDQSKHESSPQETLQKWIKPSFEKTDLKEAMSGTAYNWDQCMGYS